MRRGSRIRAPSRRCNKIHGPGFRRLAAAGCASDWADVCRVPEAE